MEFKYIFTLNSFLFCILIIGIEGKEEHLFNPADISPKFLRAFFQGLSTVKIRRTALTPFLSACMFISVPCFVIAGFCSSPLCYWVLGLGGIPLALFAVASMFLLVFDRDRLHTEEHLERRHALDIVETKGEGIMLSPVDLVNMVNPQPETKKVPAGQVNKEVSNG